MIKASVSELIDLDVEMFLWCIHAKGTLKNLWLYNLNILSCSQLQHLTKGLVELSNRQKRCETNYFGAHFTLK